MIAGGVLLALLGLAALAAGYGGAWHPAGDSLAVFRPRIAGGVLGLGLILMIAGPWPFGLLAGVLALAALAEPARLRLVPQPAGGLAVYQKNLQHTAEEPASLIFDIESVRPDVVFLQEVTARNEDVLRLLAKTHPAQHRCPYLAIGGTAIASRHPAIPGTARCVRGATILRVAAPEGPLWLVSVHLRWPWPYAQQAQAERLAEALARLDGPIVLGGDLNMVPWAYSVRRLAQAAGARPVRPAPPSFRLGGLLPVPIDHVLATGPGRAERRPLTGSDHHGILARVAPFEGWGEAGGVPERRARPRQQTTASRWTAGRVEDGPA